MAAQHGRELGGIAEIGAVGADHRKILRAAQQDAGPVLDRAAIAVR